MTAAATRTVDTECAAVLAQPTTACIVTARFAGLLNLRNFAGFGPTIEDAGNGVLRGKDSRQDEHETHCRGPSQRVEQSAWGSAQRHGEALCTRCCISANAVAKRSASSGPEKPAGGCVLREIYLPECITHHVKSSALKPCVPRCQASGVEIKLLAQMRFEHRREHERIVQRINRIARERLSQCAF